MKLRLLIGLVLALSLAANAFLAGWLISLRALPGQGAQIRELIGRLGGLPDADRRQALALVRERWSTLTEQIQALRDAHFQLRDLVASEHYSRAEAEAQQARVRAATTTLQSTVQQMVLDLADRLPAESRHELFQR